MLVGKGTAAALYVQKGAPKMQWFILASPSRHAFWGGIFHSLLNKSMTFIKSRFNAFWYHASVEVEAPAME
jgi:hypothetical protein